MKESAARLTKSTPDSEETISILAVWVRGNPKETPILSDDNVNWNAATIQAKEAAGCLTIL